MGEIQSLLNAVVDQRFAEALEEAQKVDRIIASLEGPALNEVALDQPFLGVPFSTKVRTKCKCIGRKNNVNYIIIGRNKSKRPTPQLRFDMSS